MNLRVEQYNLANLNNKQKNRLEKVSRASGTHKTKTNDLISMALEPQEERRKGVGLKKYLNT